MVNTHKKRVAVLVLALLLTIETSKSIANHWPIVLESYLSNLLSNPTITALLQDSRGNVWVGTQEGLYRFDGEDIQRYSNHPTNYYQISSNDIRSIFESKLGNILAFSYDGKIHKLDPAINKFRVASSSVLDNIGQVRRIFRLDLNQILIEGEASIYLADSDLKTAIDLGRFFTNEKSIDDLVGGAKLSNSEIAIATRNQIIIYNDAKARAHTVNIHTSSLRITAITANDQGEIYITTSDGHIHLYSTELDKVITREPLPIRGTSHVTTLANSHSFVWVGTDDGLIVYKQDLSSPRTFTTENSRLENDHVSEIHASNDYIWMGTYQGLNQISFSSFKTFSKDHGTAFGDTLSFLETRNGELFIGTYEGLFVVNKDTGKHEQVRSIGSQAVSFEQPIITMATYQDIVLLGTWRNGAVSYNLVNRTSEYLPIVNNADLAITKILYRKNDEVWLATYNSGLYKINPLTMTVQRYLEDISLTSIFSTESGNLIAVGGRTIYIFDNDKNSFKAPMVSTDSKSLHPMILSVSQFPKGPVLFGSKNSGIYSLDENGIHSKTINLRLLSDNNLVNLMSVNAMEVDSSGNLWCATNKGIISLNRNGDLTGRFGRDHDIQGDDFNAGSSYKDAKGYIFFGGPNGYTAFDPALVSPKLSFSPLLLTRIEYLTEESVILGDASSIENVAIGHLTHSIEFFFATQDFIDPKTHNYRYQLQGFDPDWIDNGNRNSAKYTNLPAGHYTLKVQGSNSAGIWNTEGINLSVRVLPPPWLTWWAYCLYAAALFVFVGILKRIYDTYLLKEKSIQMNQTMAATVNQVEDELQEQQELQDEMISEVHQHNRDSLALIQQVLAGHQDTTRSAQSLQVLQLLESSFRHGAEGLVVDFKAFTDRLVSEAIKIASVPAETITSINAVPEVDLPAKEAALLSLALNELLRNVMQRAFEPAGLAHFVEIGLEVPDDSDSSSWTLVVSDNGNRLPGEALGTSDPQGFALLQGLAEHSGGSFELHTDTGTRARFSVPASED